MVNMGHNALLKKHIDKEDVFMKLFRFILGKALGGIFAILAIVLLVGLWKLQMLPTTLIVLGAVLAALVVALVVVLTWSGEGKVWMIVGISVAVIGILATSFGSFYTWKLVNTFAGISAGETEIVQIGVYMRADDKRDISADFKFGVWDPKDSEEVDNVDSVIKKLNKDLKTTISCAGYETPLELVDALLDSELDAIILNKAYLDVWAEVPGYEEKLPLLREAIMQEVEVVIPEKKPVDKEPEYTALKDSFAVYISGIDARGGGVGIKTRSDVNIVAVVNPKTKQVLLVNTPRDYYVPISSPQSYLNGKKDKLTHAGLGGPNGSRETLSNLYGIDISYYFKVNFGGFVEIVDALDGITVHSDFDFKTRDEDGSVYYYHKGDNELDGKAALGFCRNRYSFIDGDNQRGKTELRHKTGIQGADNYQHQRGGDHEPASAGSVRPEAHRHAEDCRQTD